MSSMNLSTYLRLPIRAGARLTTAAVMAANRPFANPDANDYFQVLIDNVNQDLLRELRKEVSREAYLLAFVRGSSVTNRLELTQIYWPRIVACFALEEVCMDLERSYGRATVEALLLKIKRTIYAKLLRTQGTLGPSKLLFRIKNPPAEVLSPSNYETMVTFVNEVANFTRDTDETVKGLLFDTDLGDAERPVKQQFALLLQRFALNTVARQIETDFDRFVQIQKEFKCLHPALPMAAEAIRRIADMSHTTPDISRQLMTLFRIAWLCRLEDPKDASDFTLKSLVVIPQPETALAGIRNHAEATLATVFGAMEKIMQSHPDLKTLHDIYPEVRVSISAVVLSLPKPLFETFLAIDSGEDRLDFVTRSRMGPAYFQRHFHDLLRDPWNNQLSRDLVPLLDRIIHIKTKIGKKGDLKHETISPLDTSPMQTRGLLKSAIEHRDGEYVEQCSRLFNEVAKDDLVGRIRGVWTVKRHGEETSGIESRSARVSYRDSPKRWLAGA